MSYQLEKFLQEMPLIKQFQIFGLHGDRNVSVLFKGPATIILGENGSGKTTVLKALFSVLTKNWLSLSKINFEKCKLILNDEKNIIINRQDIIRSQNASVFSQQSHLLNLLYDNPQLRTLIEKLQYANTANDKWNLIMVIAKESGLPVEIIERYIYSFVFGENIGSTPSLEKILKPLNKILNYPVVYLPTYRRVEENLDNLYIRKERRKDDELIQFGMEDIKKRFEEITSEITKSFVESYSIISGQILTQLVRGINTASIKFDKISDLNILRIILDRVGSHLTDETKNLILHITKTKEIEKEIHKTLAYFLSNLIDAYEKQEENDNAIKNLARVVNSYFEDKELNYDESKVELRIIDKRSGKEVLIDKLSSGEKQILSIFSKLYLDKWSKNQYILLIDEPELSLSIEWQKKLLEDIMASSKCKLLLATTHSPFVFQNKLDNFVTKIRVF